MTCTEIQEWYSEYYDHALESDAQAFFEAHLGECAACAEDYAHYRALFDEVRALSAPPLPEGFHEAAMRHVIEAIPDGHKRPATPVAGKTIEKVLRRRRTQVSYRPYAFAVACVAACFILISALVSGVSGVIDATGLRMNPSAARAFEMAGRVNNEVAKPYTANAGGGEMTVSYTDGTMQMADVDTTETAGTAQPSALYGAKAIFVTADVGYDPTQMLAAGYFEQTFNIEITVEDLSRAAAVIEGLNGYNVSANRFYGDGGGSNAEYRRRVDVAAYAQVKATLRELGTVQNESESVTKLADEVFDLEARLAAKETESERLSGLLAQSKTMNVLAAVERRLGAVETERDEIRGRLNQLYNSTARPYININLYEPPPEAVPMPDDTFLERLSNRFVRSLNATITFMENCMVFFSGAFVPLLILLAFAGLAWSLVRRHLHGRRTGRTADTPAPPTDPSPEVEKEGRP